MRVSVIFDASLAIGEPAPARPYREAMSCQESGQDVRVNTIFHANLAIGERPPLAAIGRQLAVKKVFKT